jgi:methionyl-tRNA formyltransferase
MSYTFAFFGSDEFSIIVLEQLISAGYVPSLCVTQPDKPKGRKLVMTPTPLKEFCIVNRIPFITPETLDKKEIVSPAHAPVGEEIRYDFFVVASYGKIIKQNILDIPARGCLNVHPSLLPEYRGASPIETAILNDTKQTGVTVMLMDAMMDHGPILAQQTRTFETWPETKKEVHDTLATLGGKMLAETIEPFMNGDIVPVPQDHTKATFTKMIQKEDGRISLTDTNYATYLKYLALTPWPGLFFFIEKQNRQIRVKVESAHFDTNTGFVIDSVVPEGKSSMSFESFRNGYLN